MWSQRVIECAAMMMIGDSVLAIVDPKRHAELWECGPEPWRKMVRPFARNPALTRGLGVAGLVASIWLAQQQRANKIKRRDA